ncbi:hypothetical protein QMU85_002209 [Photobacterium damselae]|nr:hypothetical protein [Photobacterium damselae]
MTITSIFQQKLDAAYQELQHSGIRESNYNPPIYRLARKCGLEVPPPHYCSALYTFSFSASWFGCLLALIMLFTNWMEGGISLFSALATSIAAGIIFGAMMTLYYQTSAKRHHLSQWQSLTPVHTTTEHSIAS